MIIAHYMRRYSETLEGSFLLDSAKSPVVVEVVAVVVVNQSTATLSLAQTSVSQTSGIQTSI